MTAARRIAKLAVAAIIAGALCSLAMAMLSARDLARQPATNGGLIGGGGHDEDTLDWVWRTFTPESWHAWGDGSGYDTPTRDANHDVGLLDGDGWRATIVAGGGFYDVAFLERRSAVWKEMGETFVMESWEREERIRSGQTLVTIAPEWIPPELPRKCDGFLPGRSAVAGTILRVADVADAAWMPGRTDGQPMPEHAVATWRVDEVRAFGWPFRAFTVQGALIQTTTFRVEPDLGHRAMSSAIKWWTNGLGVDASDGWAIGHGAAEEIDSLPAKGLPLRPMWLPLLGNAIVFGTPIIALFLLARRGVSFAFARLRGQSGRCPSCGYARTGIPARARCPECGHDHANGSKSQPKPRSE